MDTIQDLKGNEHTTPAEGSNREKILKQRLQHQTSLSLVLNGHQYEKHLLHKQTHWSKMHEVISS